MDGLFPGVAPDEVREWRRHPVTMAFLRTLTTIQREQLDDLVLCVGRDNTTADREAVRIGGRLDGVNMIQRIIEEA